MKYLIKQKFLAIGDDFAVFNDRGDQLFYFDSKVLALGTKIIILNEVGHQIGLIRKKWFTIRPTFTLKYHDKIIAKIYKKLFSLRKGFVIESVGSEKITVVGSYLEHNYFFYKKDHQVAEVSKRWFTEKDTYGVEVSSDSDTLPILSCAIIIDILCHPNRDSGFYNNK